MRRRLTARIVIPLLVVGLLAVVAAIGALTMPDASPVASLDRLSGAGGGVSESAEQGTLAAGVAEGGEAAKGDFAAAVPPGGSSPAHYLIRNGDLALLIERGTLLATVDRIGAMVAGMGGYVVSSSMGSGNADGFSPVEPQAVDAQGLSAKEATSSSAVTPTEAWLTLRVPQARFEGAVKRFAKIGEVQRVTTSSEDVTAQYVDLNAQLRHYRAVERRLLHFLAATTTIREMLAVQDRVDSVQLTIEQLEAQLKSLREVTTYGTLSISLTERGTPQAGQIDPSDTFGGVLRNSLTLLARGARVLALALTAALPFVVALGGLGLVAWYLVRWFLRRRRRPQTPSVPA